MFISILLFIEGSTVFLLRIRVKGLWTLFKDAKKYTNVGIKYYDFKFRSVFAVFEDQKFIHIYLLFGHLEGIGSLLWILCLIRIEKRNRIRLRNTAKNCFIWRNSLKKIFFPALKVAKSI